MTRAEAESRLLLTVAEVMELTGWKRTATYDAIKAGTIPALRRGRCLFIPSARLLAIVDAAGHAPSQPPSDAASEAVA